MADATAQLPLGSAIANASASGATSSASAIAKSLNQNNLLASIRAVTTATGGADWLVSEVQSETAFQQAVVPPALSGNRRAAGTAMGMPQTSDVVSPTGVLTNNPTAASNFDVGGNSSMLAIFKPAARYHGSIATRDQLDDVEFAVEASLGAISRQQDLKVAILNPGFNGANGEQIELTIARQGRNVVSDTFSDIVAATAYCTDKVINLGNVHYGSGANDEIVVNWNVTANAVNSTFSSDILLGTSYVRWGGATSGNWTNQSKWVGGTYPNGIANTANFPLSPGTKNLVVNAPTTVGYVNASGVYNLAGSSTLTLDAGGNGEVNVPLGTLTISAPLSIAANNTITKTGGGTLKLITGTQSHGAGSKIDVTGGTLQANVDLGSALDLSVSAIAKFSARQHLDQLTLSGSGYLLANSLASPGALVVVKGLAIGPDSQFDLNDGDLIVKATSGTAASVLSTVTGYLANGFQDYSWGGLGGVSSGAANNDFNQITALGVMLNESNGSPYYTTFNGETIDRYATLVKYTYYGDADLSGSVDGTDYALIDNGFNAGLTGWFNGDFDYSAATDGTDYALIDNAFNGQSGPLWGGAPAGLGPIPPAANQPAAVLAGQFDPAREFAPAAAEARDPFSTVALAGDLLDLLIAGSNRRRR